MKNFLTPLIAVFVMLQVYTISAQQQLTVRRNDTTSLLLMVEPIGTSFGAFYGVDAGRKTVGFYNTILGYAAGQENRAGGSNTFVGEIAGQSNREGNFNAYFGRGTGRLSKGSENTAIGSEAGALNTLGNNNTFVGRSAGVASTGSNNVFLGYMAGSSESGSNKLYIENSSANATSALLYGEFDNKYLRENGRLEVLSTSLSDEAIKGIKSFAPGNFSDIPGVYGQNDVDDYYGVGVKGVGGYIGVNGQCNQSGGAYYYGVSGTATGTNAGINFGVYGAASGGATNYAGYFDGDSYVSGNMGIGTSDYATGYKLSVNGKIAAEEILVDLAGSWPDYVFQDDYKLPSLNELKTSIKKEGHLPGMPSAAEVKDNGVLLGDMNKMLLEKVEQLTLYIINQDERIKALEAKVNGK